MRNRPAVFALVAAAFATLSIASCHKIPVLAGLWVASSDLAVDYMELEESGSQLSGVVCETLPNAPNVTTFKLVPVTGKRNGDATVNFAVTYDTGLTATFKGTFGGGAIRGDLVRRFDGYRRTLVFRQSQETVPDACK